MKCHTIYREVKKLIMRDDGLEQTEKVYTPYQPRF